MAKIILSPTMQAFDVEEGTNLLQALQRASVFADAPCGGNGSCGKCKVTYLDQEILACQTTVLHDMELMVPQKNAIRILQDGPSVEYKMNTNRNGHLIAFDIGTTTVVCYLLNGTSGIELAAESMQNPQSIFGADVVSRIKAAMAGELDRQRLLIRSGMENLILSVCKKACVDPDEIGTVAIVGNPAMQQLFLGISPENLAAIPFSPVLKQAAVIPCGNYLPICSAADLLIVPDISGYIGADTIGCVLATKLYESEQYTLMIDIGTNGELVLGNQDRMIACATAAGPALEGANIRFGMRGTDGAIDHVWLENGKIRYSVIGAGTPTGICGSGLIDAVAVGLELGLLNKRGRIQNDTHEFYLTDTLYLTQDDIRQVQLAKGAIAAGIILMTKQLGIELSDIRKVLLAGAFGSYVNLNSACRIGLIPEILQDRIEIVGNAAGSGAKMLACDKNQLLLAQKLAEEISYMELATVPEFSSVFARSMQFREEPQ